MMLSGQEYVDDYGARIKRKMDRAEAAAEEAALAESTRSHLAYNLVIAAIVLFALATGST